MRLSRVVPVALVLGLPLLAGCSAALALAGQRQTLPPPPRTGEPVLVTVPRDSGDYVPTDDEAVDATTRPHGPEHGVFRDRFPQGVNAPHSSAPAWDDVLAARAARVRAAGLGWTDLAATRDSLPFNEQWDRVAAEWFLGAPVYLRSSVWPVGARVVLQRGDTLGILTDWVDLRRLAKDEIRCATIEHGLAGNDGPALRFRATLVRRPNGNGLITVRGESRRLSGCEGSKQWRDRVAAVRLDVWLAATRARAMGGTRIEWR